MQVSLVKSLSTGMKERNSKPMQKASSRLLEKYKQRGKVTRQQCNDKPPKRMTNSLHNGIEGVFTWNGKTNKYFMRYSGKAQQGQIIIEIE